MTADPLVRHYAKTLRLIEAMAVGAALKSMPKMPRWVPALPAPTPWDAAQVTAVAEMLAGGARMAAAEWASSCGVGEEPVRLTESPTIRAALETAFGAAS